MSSRVLLPPSKLKVQRYRRWRGLGILLGIFFILLCIGALVVLWSSLWRIGEVSVVGAQDISTSSISGVVWSDLSGTYRYVVPKNSVFFYPKQEIERSLMQEFPTLQSTSVGLSSSKTLIVSVIERDPVALWCGVDIATGTPCYLLDGSGLVYAPSANYSGNVYIRYYGAVATGSPPWQFLSPEQFSGINTLAEGMSEKVSSDTVEALYIDPSNDVHVIFGSGFVTLFSLSQNPTDVFNSFSLALISQPFQQHPLSAFAYLDLRFGQKLYYLLKGK